MKMGTTELLIILGIVLVIFGPKALPKLSKSLGKTIGSFRKGMKEDDDEDTEDEDEEAVKTTKTKAKAKAKTEDADDEEKDA